MCLISLPAASFLTASYRLIPSFARITEGIQKFQFNIQSAEKLSRDMEKFENINFASRENVPKINFKATEALGSLFIRIAHKIF